jgi:hypothetical protein
MPSVSQQTVCVKLVGIDGEVEGQLGLYKADGSLRSYEVRPSSSPSYMQYH